MDRVFVPPIKIQGIKTKLVPLIKKSVMLSEETQWVEPFMGSGVVGFNIKAKHALFCDTNPYTIEFYRQIQNGKITSYIVRKYLEQEGNLLQKGDADYYYQVRERFNKNHEPLDFLFLNRSCFNGMIRFNKNYLFNVPYGHKPQRFAKAYITKIANQVQYLEKIMPIMDWKFKCQSFEKTISEASRNTFIYCDPPYIGRHVDYYDSWDEKSEYMLHTVLKNSGAKFMLSTWDHNRYRKNIYIQKVWSDCYEITQNHFYYVGAKESNRQPVVEALLVNYPLSAANNELAMQSKQLSFFDSISV